MLPSSCSQTSVLAFSRSWPLSTGQGLPLLALVLCGRLRVLRNGLPASSSLPVTNRVGAGSHHTLGLGGGNPKQCILTVSQGGPVGLSCVRITVAGL